MILTIECIPQRCPDCQSNDLQLITGCEPYAHGMCEVMCCGQCGLQWVVYYDFVRTEISVTTVDEMHEENAKCQV